MKLNRKYLIESILEVMMEDDELSPKSDFEKLMSALTSDLSNARQAMEMYDLGAYELTPEEDAKANKVMMDIEAREIVRDSDNPGKDLKELGYDFHQIFMDAYGFTPPKSKEFKLWGGKDGEEILSLKATVGGKEFEFEFWYDQQFSKYIMEPWFRFDTMHDTDGDVSLLSDHIIINEGDIESKVSKEGLPGALRSAVGIPWNADVPEWPELPKGQPPAEGSDIEVEDEPVYEDKDDKPSAMSREEEDEIIANIKAFYKGAKNTGIKPMTGDQVVSGTNATRRGSRLDPFLNQPAATRKKNEKLNRGYLYELINEVLQETEDDSYKEIANKIDQFIASYDLDYYKQGFHIIEVYEMSDLISKEQAKELSERMWNSIWKNEVYSKDNISDIAELLDDNIGLSKEFKQKMSHDIYYYGITEIGPTWAVKYATEPFGVDVDVLDPDNLYSIGGADQETLEKVKERLVSFDEDEEHFEWDMETGRLLFGELARAYVNFEKKIEEIFGATPSGDPWFGGGAYQTISLKKSINEPFDAPMVDGGQVTADIMFEWSPGTEGGYGMEITLIPAKLGTMPQTLLQDYYGIWVTTSQEGPDIGKLTIGIQNYEDEFAEHKRVQNGNGTYGFSPEEMKEKIKELTGIDLNEIR